MQGMCQKANATHPPAESEANHIEIIPYLGSEPIAATKVFIRVNPADRARAEKLIERTAAITSVTDELSFEAARALAGEAKSMLNEIDDSRKAAKKPFGAVERAIDTVATDIAKNVLEEHERLLGLLNDYVVILERMRRAEEKAKADAARREREAYEKKIAQAQAAQRAAELEAQQARDEATRLRLQEEALKNQLLAEQQKLSQEMAEEIARIGEEPKKGLVPGGRVDHPLIFKLIDLPAVINSHRLDLLRWELNIRACQDAVRLQLELNPDATPSLPGIEITQETSVSVRATRKRS